MAKDEKQKEKHATNQFFRSLLGGHPVLAQAGVEAIRYWKWEVATHETKEIVISTSILISFSWLHFQPRFWGQFAVVLLQFRASMF
jgi:hypothetical protein